MEGHVQHSLVALQFNLGAAPGRKQTSAAVTGDQIPGTVSRHVGRHLINQYLQQTTIPDPAFIALHDVFNNEDIKTICEALKGRPTNGDGTYESVVKNPGRKTACLLYNSNIVTFDKNSLLAEDDFFVESDAGEELRLFKRLDGGLFQHNESKQFIVAVSYHGEKKESRDIEKKDNISGRSLARFDANIESYWGAS